MSSACAESVSLSEWIGLFLPALPGALPTIQTVNDAVAAGAALPKVPTNCYFSDVLDESLVPSKVRVALHVNVLAQSFI